MVNRMKSLTQYIVHAASEDDAPDISYIRGQWDAERGALRNLLESIGRGEEVSVLLGGKSEYFQRGSQFGQWPEKDTISIKLKSPSPTVAQPNLEY